LIQQENNGRRLRRVGEELPVQGNQDFISTLSPNPRSLRELWLEYKFGIDPRSLRELWFEYKFGIDGRKPADQVD
jgi:hypothetical protein